jgi:hypothetical protein
MTSGPSLDELPDEVFVALGRRGMEGIPLKECAYECDGKEIRLLSFSKDKNHLAGKGVETAVEDWLVECAKCRRQFTIQCTVRYANGVRMDTKVDILDDSGKNLGWLGSY